MKQVLFVCLGNICRSPAADGVMVHMIKKKGLKDKMMCDSAGTCAHHVGDRADERMRKTAGLKGIPLESISRQFVRDDFERFDYIVMMDQSNYQNVSALDKKDKYAEKLYMMTDFCTKFDQDDVPDPYYGGSKGFDLVLDMVEDGCSGLIEKILRENK